MDDGVQLTYFFLIFEQQKALEGSRGIHCEDLSESNNDLNNLKMK